MKIVCLTQRPIQALILIYLLGSKDGFSHDADLL